MDSETGIEHINDIQPDNEKSCCSRMPVLPTIILIALGISPILAVLIGLWALDNVILTFVLFHYVFALSIPLLLLYCVNYFKRYRREVSCMQVIKPKSQSSIFFGICVFLLGSGGIVFIYYCVAPQLDIKAINQQISEFGITKRDAGIIAFFFIYFNIINPLIEEFFWRRFLLKGFPQGQSYKWLVSLMYGSYHMVSLCRFMNKHIDQFVIAKFTNWGIGALVAVSLVIIGRMFIFFQEWKDGFLNLMAHIGGDLGISVRNKKFYVKQLIQLMLLCVLYNWPS